MRNRAAHFPQSIQIEPPRSRTGPCRESLKKTAFSVTIVGRRAAWSLKER
jgi:hypothetical protein